MDLIFHRTCKHWPFNCYAHPGGRPVPPPGAPSRRISKDALIYQHRITERDKLIADEISKRAEAELKRSGTKRARGKKKRS